MRGSSCSPVDCFSFIPVFFFLFSAIVWYPIPAARFRLFSLPVFIFFDLGRKVVFLLPTLSLFLSYPFFLVLSLRQNSILFECSSHFGEAKCPQYACHAFDRSVFGGAEKKHWFFERVCYLYSRFLFVFDAYIAWKNDAIYYCFLVFNNRWVASQMNKIEEICQRAGLRVSHRDENSKK